MPEKRIILAPVPAVKKGFPVKWFLVGGSVFLFFAVLVAVVVGLVGSASQGKVAVIRVFGVIGEGAGFLESPARPDEIVSMIDRAEGDSRVKGILVEINSPGGSPVASEEVMKAVQGSEKPTVALIRDIGTSGAYWVASGADYVVASPVSLTGSVGVTGAYLEFSEFLSQHGVDYERVVSGKFKDTGSPFRNLTGEERELLISGLRQMHGYFLQSVIDNRGIEGNETIAAIATARVFLGSEAMGLGLVDGLGGKKEAEEWLLAETGLDEVRYVSYEKKPLFDFGPALAEQASVAGSAFAYSLLSGISGSQGRIRT
ncbi:signal peptide peptidase SppA [Candidatus Woesearchaeota archaeon]|nr:signal peptide peptidase SppA [Candidatus Woesearchaeota archaeon]